MFNPRTTRPGFEAAALAFVIFKDHSLRRVVGKFFQSVGKELECGGSDWFSTGPVSEMNIADDNEHAKPPARTVLSTVYYSPNVCQPEPVFRAIINFPILPRKTPAFLNQIKVLLH
ncbi:MAG: hypothetical protein IMZ62_04560 [Chloroflexi bacterium]|nr:hypothetical protein [Chloroflexota bacterium]